MSGDHLAKLDSLLRNGEWCWKPARSDELVVIQTRLLEVRLGVADKPIWTIAQKGGPCMVSLCYSKVGFLALVGCS
jgi:hypothetical protein